MRRPDRGFTLIELMIVIAIIAILAGIALPAYQNYVARSQLSEALVLSSEGKIAVDQYWAQTGTVPTSNTQVNLAASTSITGKYVAQVAVIAGGAVQATMRTGVVSSCVNGVTLTLTPSFPAGNADTTVVWHCASSASSACVPAACQ